MVNGKWLPDFIERLKASAWHQLYLPLLPFTHARSESINADSLKLQLLTAVCVQCICVRVCTGDCNTSCCVAGILCVLLLWQLSLSRDTWLCTPGISGGTAHCRPEALVWYVFLLDFIHYDNPLGSIFTSKPCAAHNVSYIISYHTISFTVGILLTHIGFFTRFLPHKIDTLHQLR